MNLEVRGREKNLVQFQMQDCKSVEIDRSHLLQIYENKII
jgi:hypothetical protein